MSDVDNVSDIVARIIQSFERLQGIKWLSGVKDELQGIKRTLHSIDYYLFRVREQRFTSYSMRNWLPNLKFVVIDLDDVIDLILTQDLELKVYGTSLLWRFTGQFTIGNVTQELKAIRRRLDQVFQQRCDISQAVEPPVQRGSYSYVCASNVIGREEDKERIIHCLKCYSEHDDVKPCLSVFAIIGIGGIGKTTLAKLVHDDPDIVASFELRLWASVSNKFDLRSLIIDILQSGFDGDFSHFHMLQLQHTLIENLRGRTFLLVLDDVWFEDSTEWIDLRNILEVCAAGPRSRIIVTTREKRVVYITGAIKEYNLEGLSDEDCWSVFASYAFKKGEEKAYPNLVQIGKSIVQKCQGIPLVAKTLGAFLNDQKTDDAWKRVEESDFSQIAQDHDKILSVLKLSYDRIPYSLRPCFAQCAVYGKGQPLFRMDVINRWMALGLLDSKEANEDLEVAGERYFNELLSRSFFQSPGYEVAKKVIIEYGKIFDESILWAEIAEMFESNWRNNLHLVLNTFFQPVHELFFLEMHDLLHQLATHVSGIDIAVVTSDTHDVSERAMHILCNQEDLSNATWRFSAGKKARSFAFVHPVGCVSKTFLKGLISCLEYLRILDLSFSEFEKLPDSVGDLKHLRCLKLGWNSKLVGLPDSVCKLVNLQTLELFRCTAFEKLPKDIQKLVSLRFLSLSSKLVSLPHGLFGLTSLRVLRLAFCENLTSLSQEIGNMKNLRHLEIICCAKLDRLPVEMGDLTSLQQLSIFCCARLDLGGWEGLYGLEGLKYLDLNELPQLKVFPRGILRATSLQHLRIQKCEHLSELGEGLNKCTSLLKLTLNGCPMLTQIPRSIRNLKCLQQVNIDECPEIAKSCVKGGSDWDRISHVPAVIINRQHVQK